MSDDGIRSNAPRLIYLLSLAGVLFWPATLVGLAMAYINRGTAGAIELSHYNFQIATFWRGLVLVAAGVAIAWFSGIWAIMLVWLGWTVIRSVKGMLAFDRRQALPAGIGWGFG